MFSFKVFSFSPRWAIETLKENIAAQKLVFEKLQGEVKDLAKRLKEKTQALSVYSENVEEEIEQLKSDYFERSK